MRNIHPDPPSLISKYATTTRFYNTELAVNSTKNFSVTMCGYHIIQFVSCAYKINDLRLDYCNAVVGSSSMSYLAPPSRHSSRIHTRDKVLTPFRTRSTSRERTTANGNDTEDTPTDTPIDTPLDTPTASHALQLIQQQSWTEAPTYNNTLPLEHTEPLTESNIITGQAQTSPADIHQDEMSSTTSQRTQRIPIIVENYETKVTKVTGSSMTSPVDQSRPMTAPPAAAAVPVVNRPATSPKPSTKMWTPPEPSSQHHVTYHPMTSDQAQPLNHASSAASVSTRQSRPFSPTTRSAEPAVVADNRPWSPRTTQHATQVTSDEDRHSASGVSSIKFVPGSQQAPVHKFTPGQRSLSPPINPTISSGVVRVPYVPTAGVVRSSSLGGNVRDLPASPAEHGQPLTPAAAAAVTVSSSVSHLVDNTALTSTNTSVPTTSTDMQPFSPQSSYVGDPSTSHPLGYRRVIAPNPNSVSNEYQSSGVAQNRNQSFGTSPQTPVTNRVLSTENSVSSSHDNQLPSSSYQPQPVNYQQSESFTMPDTTQARPFSPQTSQVPAMTYQPQRPVNYQQPDSSTVPGPPQARPFSPMRNQVPSTNYQPESETSTISGPLPQGRPFSPRREQKASMNYQPQQPMNYQQSDSSTMSDLVQTRPFSPQGRPVTPQTSHLPSTNYQSQPDSSTMSGPSSQVRPCSPRSGQVPSLNYPPQPVNHIPHPATSTMPGSAQTRPFSPQGRPITPQTSQLPTANYQPVNYQQSESSTMPGLSQARPFSPQSRQTPSMNYQPQSDSSTIQGPPSQARTFSPRREQEPSVNYQLQQPINYQQPESSTISAPPQARPFSPQSSQLPSTNYQSQPVNYQQFDISTVPATSQARPFSPQNRQVPSTNYHSQPETSTTSDPPQTRPFSPQSSQVPSMNNQPQPVNYQHPATSAVSGPPQARPFSPQDRPLTPQTSHQLSTKYKSQPVNYQQPETSTVSDPSQTRLFSPKNSQVPSMTYQTQLSESSPMPGPLQARPLSSQTRQVPSANYQQSETSAMSGAPQIRPISPQNSHVPPTNYQSQARPGNMSGPRQVRPVTPHVGVKQHVQRFSTPGNTQVRGNYPPPQQQQQHLAVRQRAPGVTSHTGYDVTGDAQGRSFGPRDARLIQSPTDNQVQGQTRSPAVYQSGSLVTDSNVNAAQSFSTRDAPGYELEITEPGNNRFGLPGSPATNESTTLTQNIDVRGQTAVDRQLHNTPRNQAEYYNDGPTVAPLDRFTGQITCSRPYGPSTDQLARQPVYHPVTSPTPEQRVGQTVYPAAVVPMDSAVGQRPFSPVDQRVNQPVYPSVASPTTDQRVGQPAYRPATSPAPHQKAGQPVYRPVISPTPEQRAGQAVNPPITSQTAVSVDSAVGQRVGQKPFSPVGEQRVGQPVYPAVISPAPEQRAGQPVYPSVTSPMPEDQRVGQPGYRPLISPTPELRAGQPVYPVAAVPVDSAVGQRVGQRPFSPQRVAQPVYGAATSPMPEDHRVSQPGYRPLTSPTTDQTVAQLVYPPVTRPAPEQRTGQAVHPPITSPAVVPLDSTVGQRPFSPSGDQRVGQPVYPSVTSPTAVPVDSFDGERKDGRPSSPSFVNNITQPADRLLSPTSRPFSPAVSSSPLQRPSSAPSSSTPAAAAGNIQGYRRICFSPIPASVQPGHRASPVPVMLSQQAAMSEVPPAAASKDSRITVSGARLVFAPRRGSDVTAASPSPARPQLMVLRENQVADWKDSRKPIVWIPPPPAAPAAGRSHSLEPVSGTVYVHLTLDETFIPLLLQIKRFTEQFIQLGGVGLWLERLTSDQKKSP